MIINDNTIQSSSGNNISVIDGTNLSVNGKGLSFSNSVGANLSNNRPGTILEGLWGICDGSTHSLVTGNVTLQNVTTFQTLNNVHSDINGSVISYVPPPEATKVVYRFTYSHYWVSGSGSSQNISHHKFVIDGVDVLHSRHCRSSASNMEQRYTFEWVIPIGGISNTGTGRQSAWTTPKVLKMQARDYVDGTYEMNLHGTIYWDGGGGNVFNIPIINILAIK